MRRAPAAALLLGRAIAVEPLAPGMERPDLSEGGVYWYRPDHIAEYLAARRRGRPPCGQN
jgi:hypothetical protein